MKLASGTYLGPYRILEPAGRGGMATVYKAYHAALERFVAVKVLPDHFADEDGFRTRFHREAVAVAKLRHPNILTVFDHGEQDGHAYMATEFVEGGTLNKHLGKPQPVEDAVRLLGPIAQALDYAHSRGILHRDIKPANILLTDDWTPVLSDFGLAQIMGGSQARLTRADSVLGTPEYMAPEQCAGKTLTPAADQYALAVVAYEMLTGEVPFMGDTPQAVIMAHIGETLPPPRERNPELPPQAEEALLKALSKNPQHRFASCAEFIEALGSGVPGVVPLLSTKRLEPPAPARRRRLLGLGGVRRRYVIAPIALLLVLVAAAGGYALINGGLGVGAGQPTDTPSDQPSAPPSPSTLHTPNRGPLMYQMRGIADVVDMTEASAGKIDYKDGNLLLTVIKPAGSASAVVKMPRQRSYVVEVTLAPQAGSDVEFNVLLRQPAANERDEVRVECDFRNGTIAFYTWNDSTQSVLVSPVYTMQKARGNGPANLTLAIVVNDTNYQLYVNDDPQPALSADVPDIHGVSTPWLTAYGVVPGTVKVSGAWVYGYKPSG